MTQEYPPIPTVYKRDPDNHFRTLIEGHFATDELAMLADLPWIWTEKVDGTNVRADWDGETVTFEGRTDDSELPTALRRCLCQKLRAVGFRSAGLPPMTLYGEGYGLGIQKADKLYKHDGQSFVLFDVRGDDLAWLPRNEVLDIAIAMGIEAVPLRGHGTLTEMVKRVQQPLRSSWGDFQAEGLVAKPLLELQDRYGRRIITKVKARDFQ